MFRRMLILLMSLTIGVNSGIAQPFFRGADLSFLPPIESAGGVYMEHGLSVDGLEVLVDHGVNAIRLRLWHSPESGWHNLSQTIQMAQRIKAADAFFILDFHYSDTWADPGQQSKPAAWENLPFAVLCDSVYIYTEAVISALKTEGALPDMVQLGNEINCGLLWDDARVCGDLNTPTQWQKLATVLEHARDGMLAALDETDQVTTMIHFSEGASLNLNHWFFDNLTAVYDDFDAIGLSYYPWWHGNLNELAANLADLGHSYHRDIYIMETAYPWTLDGADQTTNIVGQPEHLLPDYPATVAGQEAFLTDLIDIVSTSERGKGVIYWEPDWISAPGMGSAWENLALFDFAGELLNSVDALAASTNLVDIGSAVESSVISACPNPFMASTTIHFQLSAPQPVALTVYNIAGQRVWETERFNRSAGAHQISWSGVGHTGEPASAGLYLYALETMEGRRVGKLVLIR